MLVLQQKEKWMICLILMLKMSFVYGLTKKMMAMIKKQDMECNDLFHDNDDGIDRDNGMLKSYESGNADFGPMLSSNNEYSFSTMSRVLGVKY